MAALKSRPETMLRRTDHASSGYWYFKKPRLAHVRRVGAARGFRHDHHRCHVQRSATAQCH